MKREREEQRIRSNQAASASSASGLESSSHNQDIGSVSDQRFEQISIYDKSVQRQAQEASPSTSSSVPRTIKVWVHSFIPMADVTDPLGYCYSGDNRGFDPAIHASYRTHQEIEFEVATGAKTIDWKDTGTSHELNPTTKAIIGTDKAPASTLSNGPVTRAGSDFLLHFSGYATNPLAWYAASIDLNFTVRLNPTAHTAIVEGEHDGFPAYEIYAAADGGAGSSLYNYDPVAAGEGPGALVAPMDKTASGSGTF